jgi:hypothetical protein
MLRTRHASSLKHFLEKIKEIENVKICDGDFSSEILRDLKLTGKESRPFTKDEIRKVQRRYVYFKSYFIRLGLWVDL